MNLMNEVINQPLPKAYKHIREATEESGFTMASDIMTCSLLRTLAVSKPAAKFLELGTGTGLSASWILDGMDNDSTLISIDNEPGYLAIARKFLGDDPRLELQCIDGEAWFKNNSHFKFDYIFADTWHGKYLLLDEALSMLNKGGFYIIDDMLAQPNWPEGHHEKVINLVSYLDTREDLLITKQHWATGLIIAAKR
jgi:predicted O-methyltransferase YrrM